MEFIAEKNDNRVHLIQTGYTVHSHTYLVSNLLTEGVDAGVLEQLVGVVVPRDAQPVLAGHRLHLRQGHLHHGTQAVDLWVVVQ